MSFFFETIAIPFWFIIFVLGSATPLWFKWFKSFHKKFITTGILQGKFRRTEFNDEMHDNIFKKSSNHWNENSELSAFSESKVEKRKPAKKKLDPEKKQAIRIVLKALADAGEPGVLPKSISDKSDLAVLDVNAALKYLLEKKYAEVLNGTSGMKYYLTDLGRKYCLNKKYISES